MKVMRTTIHEPLVYEVLADGLGFPEGPVFDDEGAVAVVDIDGGRILRVTERGTEVVATPGGGPNGMALEHGGTAMVANNGGFLWTEVGGVRIPLDYATHSNEPPGFAGGWMERVDLSSGEVTVLFRDVDGRALRGPNDLVFDEVGGLWFTDHGKGRAENVDRGALCYIPPGGDAVQLVAFPLLGPNGIGLAPDNRTVYVAESFSGRLWGWDLEAPGVVRPGRGNRSAHGGYCVAATPYAFDSLAVEEDGRIAIGAIFDGVVVITPDGEEIDVHPITGDFVTNIAFGGADRRRAVITMSLSGTLVEARWPRPGLALNLGRP
jgi:gluconolactonase